MSIIGGLWQIISGTSASAQPAADPRVREAFEKLDEALEETRTVVKRADTLLDTMDEVVQRIRDPVNPHAKKE